MSDQSISARAGAPWVLFWAMACALLVALLVAEHHYGAAKPDAKPRIPARLAEARLLPPFVLPPAALSGTDTVTRPLFVPGRRPAPPAPANDAPTMRKGLYLLQGTTIVGNQAHAMLREIASGKVHRVAKGDRLGDMTLSEVGPAHAVLTLGADSESIPLLVARASGAPAPQASAGPFAPPRATAAPAVAPAAAAQPPQPAPTPAVVAPAPRPAATGNTPAMRPGEDLWKLTPEELLARRRAARRAQETQN